MFVLCGVVGQEVPLVTQNLAVGAVEVPGGGGASPEWLVLV